MTNSHKKLFMTLCKYLIHKTKSFEKSIAKIQKSAQEDFKQIIEEINTPNGGALLHPKIGNLKDVYSVNFRDKTGVQYRALCTKHPKNEVDGDEKYFEQIRMLYPEESKDFDVLLIFWEVGTHEFINRLYKLKKKEAQRKFDL